MCASLLRWRAQPSVQSRGGRQRHKDGGSLQCAQRAREITLRRQRERRLRNKQFYGGAIC